MKESTTYQAIIREGASLGARQELRKVLLSQGEEQFGTPAPAWAVRALEQIDSLEQLEALAKRVLHVRAWPDLLPPPAKAPRRRKGG